MIKNYGKKIIALVLTLAMALTVLCGVTLNVSAADTINTTITFKKNGTTIDASAIKAGDTVTAYVTLSNYNATMASQYPIGALQINVGVNTSFVTVSNVTTVLAGSMSGSSAAAYNSSTATVTYADLFYSNGTYSSISGSSSGVTVMSFNMTLSASAAQKKVVFDIKTIASSGTSAAYATNDGTYSFVCGGDAAYELPADFDFSAFASLYGVRDLATEVIAGTEYLGSNVNHPYAYLQNVGQLNTSANEFYKVSTNKKVYSVGEAINVTAVGQNPSDWVAIYPFGETLNTPIEGSGAIYWIETGDISDNVVNITDTSVVNKGYRASTDEEAYYNGLTAGFYTIHIINADGTESKAAVTIEVVAAGTSTNASYNVTTDKSIYEVGQPVYVTASGTASTDWVGLYRYGDDYGDPNDGFIESIYWYYFNGQGAVDITDTSNSLIYNNTTGSNRGEYANGLIPGEYVILLFSADSYNMEYAAHFEVVAASEYGSDAGTMTAPFAGLTSFDTSYKNGVLLNSDSYAYIGAYDFSNVETITITYATSGDFDSADATFKILKSTSMSDAYASVALTPTHGYGATRTVTIDAADYAGPAYLALDGAGSVYVTNIDYRSATEPGIEVDSDTTTAGGTITGSYYNAASGWSVKLYADGATTSPVASTTLNAAEGTFSITVPNTIGMYDLYLVNASGVLTSKIDIVVTSKPVYTITVPSSEHGTVTVSSATGVAGDVITITATPNTGYAVSQILVDGVAIAGNSFTISGNHIVSATFVESTGKTITVVYGGYGKGSISVTTVAEVGSTVTFTATPEYTDAGYASACTKITSDQVTITTTQHANGQYTGGSFVMPDADVTINVNFHILGDVNLNGSIATIDHTFMLLYLRGKYTLSAEQLIAANVYGSNNTTVNTMDNTFLLLYLRGKNTSFSNNLCN